MGPGRVEIREIDLPRDTDAFVDTWWHVYRDDPHWVPPLRFERRVFFDPNANPYFESADVQCFQARIDGVAVGTISATVDHRYQDHEPGAGFFGFFEFIDDPDVSESLFAAAMHWLRERGMDRAIGPFNFNSNHEFGLLVDGFDSDPVIANPHNGRWFEAHYARLGLEPVMDWYAYWFASTAIDPRVPRVTNRLLKRHPEIRIRTIDLSRFDEEVELLHSIYEDAWEHNWGHVKMTRKEFGHLANGFKSFLDPSVCFVVEVGNETVALSVSLPDMNQVVKKMNGGLFPFGWFYFLTRRRHVDRLRVFMLGVKQKYQSLPLGALLYAKTWESGLAAGYRGAEASLILQNNHKMRGPIEKMGGRIYKTYRSYETKL